jgi:starch phosphorylase
MRFIQNARVSPKLSEELKPLEELAYNFWWTWNYELQDLFKRINYDLWYELGRSPVKLLRRVKQKRIDELSKDRDFLNELNRIYKKFKNYMKNEETWLNKNHSGAKEKTIAYFCMEYGIHESFPIYSGGLGILAGDHLKTASDMGLNFVAVGLLYKKGYFKQSIDKSGWQQNYFETYDFDDFPVVSAKNKSGEEVFIVVKFENKQVWAKVWKAMVGRTSLFLLDTDIPQNEPEDRGITENLYGGNREMRIKQEIVLGIGGVRALRQLDIFPDVWHMNEGHAAFLALERIRENVEQKQFDFKKAIEAVKSNNIFTTHTPVPAGNDTFVLSLIDKYFGEYFPKLRISRNDFISLGLEKLENGYEQFNMTILALNVSAQANGVSELHGKVSRKMWKKNYLDLIEAEVPIGHVTNGVHIWSWLYHEMQDLLDIYLPENWRENILEKETWNAIDNIPDEELWNYHIKLKKRLIEFLHGRVHKQRMRLGETIEDIMQVEDIFDEDTLTIGFARRFATYKRAALIFKDLVRIKQIVSNPDKPVQLIFAGKAHPADNPGKELIRRIYELSRAEDFKTKIVFIENYDMNVARHMVQGVDVWLNNPRRPHEASGTSGEKAGMNGSINFSALDGWWVEGFNGENGWAIGDNRNYDDTGLQDRIDSVSIYSQLEKSIVPLYYKREEDNVPRLWAQKMKASIKSVGYNFNTHRMIKDYTENYYLKAIKYRGKISKDNFQMAQEFSVWKEKLLGNWKNIRINPKINSTDTFSTLSVGTKIRLSANIYLGNLKPDEIEAQIFVGYLNEDDEIEKFYTIPMKYKKQDIGNEYFFEGEFELPEEGRISYTIRVVPNPERLIAREFLPIVKWA